MQVALPKIEIKDLPGLLCRFGDWWLREFLELFPARVGKALRGRGRMTLVIATDAQGAVLELLSEGQLVSSERVGTPSDLPSTIERLLHANGYSRAETDIGLRLPTENVFSRQLLLPVQAVAAIDAVAAQDLARKTPFKPEDVFSDHGTPEPVGGDRVRVWQWVVRRQYVRQALSALAIDLESIAFVLADSADVTSPPPVIRLQAGGNANSAWSRRIPLGLCASAAILALVACGLKYWNQQSVLQRLDQQIAAVSNKAQQVRVLADQTRLRSGALQRLRLQRIERPGLIDVWEEVTRVLPPHSWLTEFRLETTPGKREPQIALSGFSGAAPSLVGIIDGSPLFTDAALTSPIALDAAEGRERFALQAGIRAPDGSKGAPR